MISSLVSRGLQLNGGDHFVLQWMNIKNSSSNWVSVCLSGEVSKSFIKEVLKVTEDKKIKLAVQFCEHLNRALVVERELAEKNNLEIVSVIPALNAGGALSVAAFKQMKDPVLVEHITAKAGIDIGDTEIGMHIRFVQVPLRLKEKYIGKARVTALKSRPKLIGGVRAIYE